VPHRLHVKRRSRLPEYKNRREAYNLRSRGSYHLLSVLNVVYSTTIAKSWNKPKVLLGSENQCPKHPRQATRSGPDIGRSSWSSCS
ncbi:unnamed protein product, partial [Brassica rapa subsp. trilocularis]